jgi:hypothetical protein
LEQEYQENKANVEAAVQNHVQLAHSLYRVVLVVEADPGSDGFRFQDQWISIDIGGESKMQNNREWQKLHDTVTQLLGEVDCLPIVVEDQELVYPELDEENEEVHEVETWHS